jgi:hypothetical protein
MPVPTRIELTGQRFGRLEVKAYDGLRNAKGYWRCLCKCGAEVSIAAQLLRNGKTTSCGCYRAELMSKTKRKHGMVGTPEYNAYSAMLGRCLNRNNHKFLHYGGRGIKVCSRWRKSFASFYADMGPRPDGCSLDRIDVNGDYSTENCRWATATQQAQNKTTTINLTHDGKTKCLTQWAREFEVPMLIAYRRLQRGLPFEQVFAGREP